MTGADIFRIAKGLGISTLEVLFKHTRGYIGDTTHLPVAVLKERLDGSCSFLRKGKCTIQAFKPTPCALYPLGRMYDERDKKFYYFNQPYSCGKSGESGRVWTLQEWIDEFHLEDYLDDVAAWNKLVVGLAMITKDIPEEKLDQSLAKVVMFGLYGDYDTSKPYQEEVQKNMVQLKAMLKDTHLSNTHSFVLSAPELEGMKDVYEKENREFNRENYLVYYTYFVFITRAAIGGLTKKILDTLGNLAGQKVGNGDYLDTFIGKRVYVDYTRKFTDMTGDMLDAEKIGRIVMSIEEEFNAPSGSRAASSAVGFTIEIFNNIRSYFE